MNVIYNLNIIQRKSTAFCGLFYVMFNTLTLWLDNYGTYCARYFPRLSKYCLASHKRAGKCASHERTTRMAGPLVVPRDCLFDDRSQKDALFDSARPRGFFHTWAERLRISASKSSSNEPRRGRGLLVGELSKHWFQQLNP